MQFNSFYPVLIYSALVKLLYCQKIKDDFCTDKEIQKTGCIHGECFVVVLAGSREPSCHCDEDYVGTRCQELNIELIILARSNVYIIIGVIVLVAVLASIIVLICYRRMRELPISDIFDKETNRQLLSASEERAEFHKTGSDKKPETWTEIDKSNGNRL